MFRELRFFDSFMCVCVCACACVRAYMRACVSVYVCKSTFTVAIIILGSAVEYVRYHHTLGDTDASPTTETEANSHPVVIVTNVVFATEKKVKVS